jgi:hypothetical protein
MELVGGTGGKERRCLALGPGLCLECLDIGAGGLGRERRGKADAELGIVVFGLGREGNGGAGLAMMDGDPMALMAGWGCRGASESFFKPTSERPSSAESLFKGFNQMSWWSSLLVKVRGDMIWRETLEEARLSSGAARLGPLGVGR